ncbi:type II CAAX prenyl endopeptidase Rce1 family protein [Runella sp.]|uniref:CPBP family glutamic-type intramembrane protease n=1 Tax=Runella sp. TaxID=1960881 RepID=UPI00260C4CAB|nr:CPBP family glutamic-type intramembrane protease [Runella sp.]
MLLDILLFIRNPYLFSLVNNKGEKPSEKTLIKSFLLCILFLLLSVFVISITDMLIKAIFSFSIKRNLEINRSNSYEYWGMYRGIISVIGAPIIEEIVFILPLTSKKKWFLFSVCFGLFFFLNDSIYSIDSYTLIGIVVPILSFILLQVVLQNKESIIPERNFFNFWCYFLIISFSWVHISNFSPINWQLIYFYPIYVLPQLFYGIILSYLMVKYKNIIWPILLHIMINLTGFLLSYF